jgi:tRNA threonylcarbamoyladenosine biosynthesis protein TsaE
VNLIAAWDVLTRSEEETISLGRAIGESLSPGDAVLISGELGAGKTRLVQGIAAGLRTADRPRSPTFVLVNRHIGRLVLHHCDLYRLGSVMEVEDLGLMERVEDGDVLAVEWPERARAALPEDALEVTMEQGPGQDDRSITLTQCGPGSSRLLQAAQFSFNARNAGNAGAAGKTGS